MSVNVKQNGALVRVAGLYESCGSVSGMSVTYLDWTATSSSAAQRVLTDSAYLDSGDYLGIVHLPHSSSTGTFPIQLKIGSSYTDATPVTYSNQGTIALIFNVPTDNSEVCAVSGSSSSQSWDNLQRGGLDIVKLTGRYNSEIKYSTTERKVGTWLDGRDVFEKSIQLSTQITIGTTWTDTNIVLDNDVEAIVYAETMRNTAYAPIEYEVATVSSAKHIRGVSYRSTSLPVGTVLTIHYIKTAS